ncbi:unnamed protein product [Linum tenue]|uniref:Uncharacterized protein n=1 Tax=Linum tenue TaxID=586396 RepID=A0AAV0NWP0_9ROSI|nr:unnamed protein product [Linum tenue]
MAISMGLLLAASPRSVSVYPFNDSCPSQFPCSLPSLNFVPMKWVVAVAARGGAETLKPSLQRLYVTRASAYRDALKSFIEGYQEGVQQVIEKKEESNRRQEGDPPSKSV